VIWHAGRSTSTEKSNTESIQLCLLLRTPSSGTWCHVVWWIFTNILEVHAAYIFGGSGCTTPRVVRL
jgi:hypothetical protein